MRVFVFHSNEIRADYTCNQEKYKFSTFFKRSRTHKNYWLIIICEAGYNVYKHWCINKTIGALEVQCRIYIVLNLH